jgi:hypothetical protein
MIDCAVFERLLDSLLAGTLSADEERAMEAHASGCDRCSALLGLVRSEEEIAGPQGGPDLPGETIGDDLTAGILERTSGSPCERAGSMLCDWVDGALPAADAELIGLHFDHCSACAELAAVVAALRADLPSMAELEPDPWFVRDILDATTRRETAGVAEPALAAARSVGSWSKRLLDRPRLALELAYSGAMVIFLLWGTPVSPLRGTAEKALGMVQAGPVEGITGAEQSLSYLAGGTASAAQGAWRQVGTPIVADMQGLWRDARHAGAERLADLSILNRSAGGIWRSMTKGDLVEAGRILAEALAAIDARRSQPAKDAGGKSDRTPAGVAP